MSFKLPWTILFSLSFEKNCFYRTRKTFVPFIFVLLTFQHFISLPRGPEKGPTLLHLEEDPSFLVSTDSRKGWMKTKQMSLVRRNLVKKKYKGHKTKKWRRGSSREKSANCCYRQTLKPFLSGKRRVTKFTWILKAECLLEGFVDNWQLGMNKSRLMKEDQLETTSESTWMETTAQLHRQKSRFQEPRTLSGTKNKFFENF